MVAIVRGSSGAGKTTFIDQVLGLGPECIGPDKVRTLLKQGYVMTGTNDNQYDLECYALTRWICDALIKRRDNVLLERTIEYIEDLHQIASLCQSCGYNS
jgi:ABC-type glutathione transport system ATPase component